MPNKNNYRYRKRRNKKARNNGSKGRYKDSAGRMQSVRVLIPDRTLVTLKYTEKIQFNPAATTYEYVYRGNSINDPNFTGTGGRPVGYNEWQGFYNRYRVIGSSINLDITGSTATTICVFPSLSSAGVTGYADAVSQPYARWVNVAGSGGFNVRRLFNKIGTSKISGQKILQDDLYGASFTSDPSAAWYWCLNMDAGASNVDITCTITIAYTTILYRKVNPDTSTLSAEFKQIEPSIEIKED